jgi:Family of unknown function (DUF6297)
VTITREAIAVPDSTRPTIALLRELRRGRVRKRAGDAAFWIYVIVLAVALYGGEQIAAAFRALRHPPPPGAGAAHALHAAPYGTAALALVVLLVLVRDAQWRGPVTLPQPTVDWLLGTPVDRARLLRPRFRLSAMATTLAGAAVGIVPAATLVGFGLGGHTTGSVLRLIGAGMASTALLFALGTGLACLVERYRASWRWLRGASQAALAAAAVFAGMAAWAAVGRPPAVAATVVAWSGPWGWAGQGMVALAGGAAPLWPLATALLGVAALGAVAAGHRAAAGVPGIALRDRAATMGAMSAAVLNMDTRGVANAYGRAAVRRRARFRLRPPRRRELVLLWRDLLAVARTPARLAGAVALALLAAGLLAAAGHRGQASLLPVGCALSLGYLAAAWLCEGARLDAEDVRRSEQLSFRFASLAWWHGAVPCLVLLVVAGVPVAVASVVAGEPRFLLLLAVTVPLLVAGALVNVFRGEFSPDMFAGVDTPYGNTAAIKIIFWSAWGPVLAVVPMTALLSSALGTPHGGALARAVVIGGGLAAGLWAYAARRAARLRA